MRWMGIVCVVCAALAGLPEARGAQVSVNGFQHSEPFYETHIGVYLWGGPAVTGVRAVAADATPVTLAAEAPEQFAAWLGPFPTFDAFRNATVGAWQLILELGGGEAVYDLTVNDFRTPFTSASFPPAPTVLSPPDGAAGVGPTPTFVWDSGGPHTGAMESLFVNLWSQVDPAVGELGGIPLDAETWTPSIVLPAGLATFLVQYETNENEGDNVEDPVFNAAASTVPDPGILWPGYLGSSGDLYSRDLIEFTVGPAIPEPASLVLVLLGHLAVCHRLRSRRRSGRK